MDYAKTARELLPLLGGRENIKTVTHCMTRLRFVLKEESQVDDGKIKAVKGVMGIARKGGQYQVIIGNDVSVCFAEFSKLSDFGNASATEGAPAEKKKITPAGVVNGIIDAIAGSIAPVLPAIIGCGMVKLLITILDLAGVSAELPTYQFLSAMGDAAFYFLPLLIAMSAADKFGCSRPLTVTLTAVLLHPTFNAQIAEGSSSFLGLPVTAATYSSSVLPALLIAWVFSKAEPTLDRYMRGWVKTIFKPMLVLVIGAPVAFVILGPIGAVLGDGMAYGLAWMQNTAGWLAIGLLSAFMPLIVMAGMHYALIPNCLSTLGLSGFETLLGPTMLASNMAQASASAAVALRTKNRELKSVSFTSAVSAFVAGITEPAVYGVTMRLKRPLAASMIGSGCAGLFAGIVGLQNYALVTPALVALPQFISAELPMNFVYALITLAISVIVTFVLTLVFGWEDPAEEKDSAEETAVIHIPENVIAAPLSGEVKDLSACEDEVFASGTMGRGVIIEPSEGKVYAPCDGKIENFFETKHAIGILATNGAELLIHVGMDTVSLNGEGFTAHAKTGDHIRVGQLLLEFDMELIRSKGLPLTTPVIITNSDTYGELTFETGGVRHGEALITL